MSAVISVVQNAGVEYAGFSQEVAKNKSYLLPIDDATASATANPIRVSDIGNVYSFECYIRCRCDLAPNAQCSNFKVWYDSGMPTPNYEVTVNSDAITTYAQPVNTVSARGTRVSFVDYTSEEDSIALGGTLININDYTDWLVFQLHISAGAEPGTSTIEYYIQYDEE